MKNQKVNNGTWQYVGKFANLDEARQYRAAHYELCSMTTKPADNKRGVCLFVKAISTIKPIN